MKKVGQTSEFLFGIYWWTWKTTIKKNCWSGPINKCKNFNIRNLIFLKQNQRKTSRNIIILHLCTKNFDDMIYSSRDIVCGRLKLVIWFYKFVSKTTIIWGTVPKIQSETDRIFFHFGVFLALLPFPLYLQQPGKSKFWINEKSIWRCHHFPLVYQKS